MSDLITYRPGGARYVAYGVAVVLTVMTVVIAAALPDYVYFRWSERFTLALLLIGVLALLHGVGRSTVRLSDDGIEVRNGYRRHFYPWGVVRGVSFRDGAPWPTLVVEDDERVMLFALQRSDGTAARDAVQEIARRAS